MCGIFGYVGDSGAVADKVLDALRLLEYRGYDSWGVAVGGSDQISVAKQPGRIGTATVSFPDVDIAFGHTRWATHGGVTQANAHPHLDCSGRIAVIHNGIIENFLDLRSALAARGHRFVSETDSEVVAHLVEEELGRGTDLVAAVAAVFGQLDGLNAIIVMDLRTRTLVASKSVSPLVVGANCTAMTIASDAVALRAHADRLLYLEDDQVVRLAKGSISLFDRRSLVEIVPAFSPIESDGESNALGAFPTFMAKEMAEQPEVVERLLADAGDEIEAMAEAIAAADDVVLLGCGTASYAAQTGAHLLGRIAGRRVVAALGSEFKYQERFLGPNSLVIALSQSGETADVIEAMLAAKARGATLAALVNARRSTLDRLVARRILLRAGPEQCVLSTKAYTAKVAALLLVAHHLAGTPDEGRRLLQSAADGLRTMLTDGWVSAIDDVARRIVASKHLFVIGRGLAHPTALEAALKIKEVSYIHAEGFAGGELKHGVIALVEDGTPCLVYAPNDETKSDIISGAMELKSRGGYIIGVGPDDHPVFDTHIWTPDAGDAAPIVNALPAQMLGYHLALLLGYDPDKPRNLAKSVTVK